MGFLQKVEADLESARKQKLKERLRNDNLLYRFLDNKLEEICSAEHIDYRNARSEAGKLLMDYVQRNFVD